MPLLRLSAFGCSHFKHVWHQGIATLAMASYAREHNEVKDVDIHDSRLRRSRDTALSSGVCTDPRRALAWRD